MKTLFWRGIPTLAQPLLCWSREALWDKGSTKAKLNFTRTELKKVKLAKVHPLGNAKPDFKHHILLIKLSISAALDLLIYIFNVIIYLHLQ